MDNSTQTYIGAFLAQYDTLAIATEDEGQPYVTRVFYAEGPIEEHELVLYGTFITSSRKLANLRNNPRVGLFIGPQEPTMWLEGTATARVLTDEKETQKIREVLGQKSSVAAGFIARVPIAAVELKVHWLRITDVAANPMRTEVTFETSVGKELGTAMNQFQLLLQATRARTLPVMLSPVLIGAVLAWQQGTPFHWGLFVLTLIGALAAHLGANVVNDVFDFAEGTDQAAQKMMPEGTTIATGSQILMKGQLSLKAFRGLAIALFALALLCGIVIAFYRPLALVFGIVGFLLAFFYVAPPLRLAYIGRGLGELDILISFGMLPLVGSYYVQSGTVTLSALLASLPIGLYTMAVLYFHHFLHWRADQEVGKITPIVALGERGARIAGALVLLLIAIMFLLDAALQVFPWYSFLAAFTVIPVLLALRAATGDLKHYVNLMVTNLNNNLLAALIIVVALVVRGVFRV